jgi:hypothetical protein
VNGTWRFFVATIRPTGPWSGYSPGGILLNQ